MAVGSVFASRAGRGGPERRRYTLVLVLFTLILVVVNVANWRTYAVARRALDAELGARLEAIAILGAEPIDADYVQDLARGDPDALGPLIVRDHFASLVSRLGLANAALLDAKGDALLDWREDVTPGTRHPLAHLHPEVFTAARTGIPAASERYESLGNHFMAGYAPVHAPDGSVVAVVAVEAGARFFDALARVRHAVWIGAVASGLAILSLAIIFVGVLRAQFRLEETLRRTETLSIMGEMAASVAHEIKNPLGIIRASAERLRGRVSAEEELLAYIPEEVDRLDAILTTYLDFARSGGGDASAFCDVGEVVSAALRLTRRDLDAAGVALDVSVPEGTRAAIHPSGLQQVLLNLVLNARHAMPEGGRLSLRAETAKDTVTLSVADTGVGIAEADLARVFEPFYSGRERGSGLGLAITRRVVTEAGGRIDVESREGHGTTFRIRLAAAS